MRVLVGVKSSGILVGIALLQYRLKWTSRCRVMTKKTNRMLFPQKHDFLHLLVWLKLLALFDLPSGFITKLAPMVNLLGPESRIQVEM